MKKIRNRLFRSLTALLYDCPYALYWYDKTAETGLSFPGIIPEYDSDRSEYMLSFDPNGWICFSLPVAQEYAAGQYLTDRDKIEAVQTTVETVEQIITDNKDKTDLEKLKAYKESNRIIEIGKEGFLRGESKVK